MDWQEKDRKESEQPFRRRGDENEGLYAHSEILLKQAVCQRESFLDLPQITLKVEGPATRPLQFCLVLR